MTDNELKKVLDLTDEELKDLKEYDKKIEKGEKLGELSAEGKKNAKKYANIGTKIVKTAPKRKENTEKSSLITQIYTYLSEKDLNSLEIKNKEREIVFKIGSNSYSLVLTKHNS